MGSQTEGGLRGRILRVTTLAPSGPGSLRDALEAGGPRLVVFEVGGVIDLNGETCGLDAGSDTPVAAAAGEVSREFAKRVAASPEEAA